MSMLTKAEEERDVPVTWEDQNRINKFSRKTAKVADLKRKLDLLQKDKQAVEDASTELMMLIEETEKVPIMVGETQIEVLQDEAQEMLDEKMTEIDLEVNKIEDQVEEIKGELAELKVELYAKFGKSINLETD